MSDVPLSLSSALHVNLIVRSHLVDQDGSSQLQGRKPFRSERGGEKNAFHRVHFPVSARIYSDGPHLGYEPTPEAITVTGDWHCSNGPAGITRSERRGVVVIQRRLGALLPERGALASRGNLQNVASTETNVATTLLSCPREPVQEQRSTGKRLNAAEAAHPSPGSLFTLLREFCQGRSAGPHLVPSGLPRTFRAEAGCLAPKSRPGGWR